VAAKHEKKRKGKARGATSQGEGFDWGRDRGKLKKKKNDRNGARRRKSNLPQKNPGEEGGRTIWDGVNNPQINHDPGKSPRGGFQMRDFFNIHEKRGVYKVMGIVR